jgi:succinoglycan biosynthesis transport protein ExoP
MSQPDHPRGSIPALTSGPVDQPPTAAPGVPDSPGARDIPTPRRRLSAGLAWRALRRHWWQATLLWLAGSAGLMALAHDRIRPRFEAFSAIKIEPGDRGLFREPGPGDDFEVFKQTQARRITNPNVIASALAAHPELLRMPRLAHAADPEAEAREALSAVVVPGTNLIRVSMTGESADEAARLVDAVVDAYLRVALEDGDREAEQRCRRLREAKRERSAEVRRSRETVARLVDRIGSADVGQARDRNAAAIEAYRVLTRQHLQVDLELIEAQARLDRLRAELRDPPPVDAPRSESEMIAEFYAAPEVAEIQSQLTRARDGLAQADRVARILGDPSRAAAKKKVEDLQAMLDSAWTRMRPALSRAGRPAPSREPEVQAAGLRVDALKARLGQLGERLGRIGAQTRSAGSDELTLEFARQDLERAESVLDTVSRGLDRVEFQARDPVARFGREFRARASTVPDLGPRTRAMAGAPVGVFLAVLGLFTLIELRAGRVVDPEDVPARLQLSVLGVVPPLPRKGQATGRPRLRPRRDLDQFVQSLDHLRVAICSGRDARGRPRRSIVITSACGGEGKTTLAAQLAERCANAGLATLLIDADLRNPTLSRMFDRPEARGLVDVLRGEAMPEEAIAVIGDAGGFHFLPAGSTRVDPGRLLQSDRLSRLLARARESFDLVIVDAPPVLPVPDALTIGRWVDGAVLAVRYDRSRYPLVGRANLRLAAVGVPVLGAVISGVRGTEAAYHGPYYPSAGVVAEGEWAAAPGG